MKSPANQNIVQIDITNACVHQCSNCTRHCGHHEKPFFMDFETFKKAVDSLENHPGMVGIMGGEPTIHPEFEKFVNYCQSRLSNNITFKHVRQPLSHFTEHVEENLAFDSKKRYGLWTSLGAKYYEHFEIIQDTFSYQCINDHSNPGMHQALLVARKDLGINDDEWEQLRDKCWIQNLWSSSITPKGAFFCEVAGALDMLFNGPGGWPIEPGWWKREPKDFGNQLNWCELCGAALQVPRRKANEEIDDISPTLEKKLITINSPQLRKGQVDVIDTANYHKEDYKCDPSNEWYLPEEDNSQRVSGTNSSLYPKRIDAIIVTQNASTSTPLILEAKKQFDNLVVAQKDKASRTELINEAITRLKPNDWVAILDEDVILDDGFVNQLKNWILNPGCLYQFNRNGSWSKNRKPLILTRNNNHANQLLDKAFCSLFNVRAHAIRDLIAHIETKKPNLCNSKHWPIDKRIDMHTFFLEPDPLVERRRIGKEMATHAISLWKALHDCNRKIALLGAGHHTRWLLKIININSMPKPLIIMDDNSYNFEIEGIPVIQPKDAKKYAFDTVLISADPGRMTRILKTRSKELWGETLDIVEMYSHFPEGRFMKILPNTKE